MISSGGAWVVQSVEHLALGLSSGLDHRVVSSGPVLGSALGLEPTGGGEIISSEFIHGAFII